MVRFHFLWRIHYIRHICIYTLNQWRIPTDVLLWFQPSTFDKYGLTSRRRLYIIQNKIKHMKIQ